MRVVIKKPKIFNFDLTVKFCPETENAKVPTQTTPHSAGYDLYAAEAKTILPRFQGIVSLDLRWIIPEGFYGKIFSRSGLFVKKMVTAQGGVIDSGYRGVVKVLLFNHVDTEPFSVEVGDRIAQVVFMKKFDVNFERVQWYSELEETLRGEGGFGSTGKN